MKILFIVPELGYGGAETALLRLANELAKRHTVIIAVFCKNYQSHCYSQVAIATPVPIVEMDKFSKPIPWWIPNRLARWWLRSCKLRSLKHQSDISISFLGGANLLNALFRAGKPCVLSERGSKRYDKGGNWLSRWIWCSLLDPLAYRRASRIVCVSEGLSREIHHSLPRQQRSKVITIAGYLDPDLAMSALDSPIEPELLNLRNRPMLLAAGRFSPQKGLHHLLPLFAQVAPSVPCSGLVLIGDGPQQHELIALAKALNLTVCISNKGEPFDLTAQVIFLGYRSHPARYTKLSRAFVMPSLWEGLPNLLLEALAAGSWCLAANCPWGPSEILTEPELGRLLPPIQLASSRDSWLTALHEALLHSPPRHLSIACRQQLVDRFSIQRSAQRWEALLDELVG